MDRGAPVISAQPVEILPDFSRILYVEDEPDIQLVVSIPLQAAGFQLEVCDSGQEALKKALAFQPDLILLDVMMPGMDGPTTMQELRRIPQFQETPVIFMTAKTQKQEINQFLQLGAMAVIMKPFDPLTLVSRLRDIWKVLAEREKSLRTPRLKDQTLKASP